MEGVAQGMPCPILSSCFTVGASLGSAAWRVTKALLLHELCTMVCLQSRLVFDLQGAEALCDTTGVSS
jgi:hypothetical protein